MTETNTDTALIKLAKSYGDSHDARVRNMIRGKAWKLINRVYTVVAVRETVWAEWCKLADPKGWLSR